ncbi:uncharacterized protein DNG_08758 [Cephalotrichum gorgonifer]|uniref:Beta-galactosidase n=1 Tax=Cephalotrichum gorgonifer TaxID=2041049 RepID=A0AAE8N5M2_9PEZI|nr:uncharacterized protein DNG_08758 [Cephalotrichum gorgonifer]
MYLGKVLSSLAGLVALGTCSPSNLYLRAENQTAKFSYDANHFYVDGEEFIMFGGQMDPQRIPREYWGQRLQMAKSMGLNTIFSYIYWNMLEPSEGTWDFEGVNDIAAWYQAIEDAGLYAVLRPGSYICGERDWGGLPSWLGQISNMTIRDNNPQFLDYSENYLKKLEEEIRPSLANNGGPILMVQVENEYGSWGSDHSYTGALADIFRDTYDAILYTNDGGQERMLKGGHIPGILAEIDGDAYVGFPARNKFTPESCHGPLLNGEWYITWFDPWNPAVPHTTSDGDPELIAKTVKDMEWMVDGGNSFNIYMFHGGTNFGFGNGAINITRFQPFSTSYDYGAPLDETGRPSEVYLALRESLTKYNPSIPEIPDLPPLASVADFELTPVAGLFDHKPRATSADSPITMDALGQAYGFTLYEHKVKADASGTISPGDFPRDRVIVYVNDVRQGVIDRTYTWPATVDVTLKAGDKLGLFVENLGRVDYGPGLDDPEKGIVGDVTVGGEALKGWKMFTFPLEAPPQNTKKSHVSVDSNDGPPVFYKGSFETNLSGLAADTLLELPGGIKGQVWVNGQNLGRYWTIGPQQQLYLPGCFLKQDGPNEVVVLELEPRVEDRVARGLSVRTWGNNEDPDCGNCIPE